MLEATGLLIGAVLYLLIVFLAYILYSRSIQKKKENGIASLATLRPIWVGLYCISLWVAAIVTFFEIVTHHQNIIQIIYAIIVSVAGAIIAWGLWELKRWGYRAILVYIIITFIYSTLFYAILTFANHTTAIAVIIGQYIIAIAQNVAFFFYVRSKRNVRALFEI